MANEIVEYSSRLLDLRTELTLTERTVAVVAGLGLAAVGAQPRPNKILSLAAVIAGSALAIRGAVPARGGDERDEYLPGAN